MKPYTYDARTRMYTDEQGRRATSEELLDTPNNIFHDKADAFLKYIPQKPCVNCGAPKPMHICDYCKS